MNEEKVGGAREESWQGKEVDRKGREIGRSAAGQRASLQEM